ncbi:hypothetical protein GCM10022223_42930 [Kineosporia mesophila]|uniref:Uncharacterized protein n=1 Tax=Kineosporia mesophila TaxID=566012 RepID=A0ABP6ZWF9_9ACTN|nr:hypothetical protein [Kineosporia mesophila]MCD5353268.1 hypothetical protein [Kineosporia mesophila]
MNGESWFIGIPTSYADYPDNWQYPLRQHHVGPMKTDILMTAIEKVASVQRMVADATSVLRATVDRNVDPQRYGMDLVDLKTKKVQRIADSPDEVAGVALSKDLLVRATKNDDGGCAAHQKPRDGGAEVVYLEDDPHADVTHLAAGGGGVAYLVHHPVDPENSMLRAPGCRSSIIRPHSTGICRTTHRVWPRGGEQFSHRRPGVFRAGPVRLR